MCECFTSLTAFLLFLSSNVDSVSILWLIINLIFSMCCLAIFLWLQRLNLLTRAWLVGGDRWKAWILARAAMVILWKLYYHIITCVIFFYVSWWQFDIQFFTVFFTFDLSNSQKFVLSINILSIQWLLAVLLCSFPDFTQDNNPIC